MSERANGKSEKSAREKARKYYHMGALERGSPHSHHCGQAPLNTDDVVACRNTAVSGLGLIVRPGQDFPILPPVSLVYDYYSILLSSSEEYSGILSSYQHLFKILQSCNGMT